MQQMKLVDLLKHKLANRQFINNPDGSISTERGISFQNGGKYYVTPSIINGVQYTPQQAMRMADLSKSESFQTQDAADNYSIHRSRTLGLILRRLMDRR